MLSRPFSIEPNAAVKEVAKAADLAYGDNFRNQIRFKSKSKDDSEKLRETIDSSCR